MHQRTCVIEGCEKPTRSGKADWCKMHYHRWYRHGSTDKVATNTDVTASHGRLYRMISAHGHPLAHKSGRAYEHRGLGRRDRTRTARLPLVRRRSCLATKGCAR